MECGNNDVDDGRRKAEKCNCTAVNRMILGVRYQQLSSKGNIMGYPFDGTNTTGYDNAHKMYVSTWMDNMNTGILNMDGTWYDATKSVTMNGKCIAPLIRKIA